MVARSTCAADRQRAGRFHTLGCLPFARKRTYRGGYSTCDCLVLCHDRKLCCVGMVRNERRLGCIPITQICVNKEKSCSIGAHLSTMCAAISDESSYPCEQDVHYREDSARILMRCKSRSSIPTVFASKRPLYSDLSIQAHYQEQGCDGNAQHGQYHDMSSTVVRVDEIGRDPWWRGNGPYHGHFDRTAASR